jgi:hypothetical protein
VIHPVPLRSLAAALAISCCLANPAREQDGATERPLTRQEQDMVEALRVQSVGLDPRLAACWIPVDVQIRDELLEYLLVGPAGASHESLFMTPVHASVLNVALLALGAKPGENATWKPKVPRPSDEALAAGESPYEVKVPQGDTYYLYAAWRVGDEVFCYRIEDLLRNLASGHSMQRHGWVYLGSRMISAAARRSGGDPPPDAFAADVYQNLINISFFTERYTLLTAALPECVEQAIWLTNASLVPERGTRVTLVLSKQRFTELPAAIAACLPEVEAKALDARLDKER